ncbi:WD40-repeat-containing domain protein [Phaeosphaeria sp. MPI-PUGE-AT-0046c]|nr:WD40-repeat-containing domain protein [Phaeosphaeria sp. MPI-PUGE-AT-0046c]
MTQQNAFGVVTTAGNGSVHAGNTYNTGGGTITISATNSDTDARSSLRAWRLTNPRDDRTRILASKDPLLEGSCDWILNSVEFAKWWEDDKSRIFWIHGDPGKGKTMMMMALIEEVARRVSDTPDQKAATAFFFCQNSVPELSNAASIVRGLTFQLANEYPALEGHLLRKYSEAKEKLFEGNNVLSGLWHTLVSMAEDASVSRLYLLVDALDECEQGSLENFFNVLSSNLTEWCKIKWVFTSRNTTFIRGKLLHLDFGRHTSLEANTSHVNEAVMSFIRFKVDLLAKQKSYSEDLRQQIRQDMEDRADGTFLWVALVCKELERVKRRKTLSTMQQVPAGLPQLYQRMLEQITAGNDEEDRDLCKSLLRTITIAQRPLHQGEIGQLAGLPSDCTDSQSIKELVDSCGSFLITRKGIISFVHLSAKDYFTTGAGCAIFSDGQSQAHEQLFCILLSSMSQTLKTDILGMHRPGTRVQEATDEVLRHCLPLHVQYACCHWIDHLANSKPQLCDNDNVHNFLKEHCLHWLEAISWMSKISEGIRAISSLEMLTRTSSCQMLHAFVYDIHRITLYSRMAIELAPLQVYRSALVFAPMKSVVRRQFSEHLAQWRKGLPRVVDDWSVCLQTLEENGKAVVSVAVSPDSTRLASASGRTVSIWDMSSGAHLQMLEGHNGVVTSVAFSPDLTHPTLASASSDGTIKIWAAKSGACLRTLKDHGDYVNTIAFSPNLTNPALASASSDSTIKIWDIKSGAYLQMLEGHRGGVTSVAFSPDSTHPALASASSDRTIKIWDAKSGACLQTLEGHSDYVHAVAFSPDSTHPALASASSDGTIKIWDAKSCACLRTLEGHSGVVTSVAFSPNLTHPTLASASNDGTIKIWDAKSGACLQTLYGPSHSVYAVAFSSNSTLASASEDGTIKIWDTSGNESLEELESHDSEVMSVAFSPDSIYLASASDDKTVKIWDVSSCVCLKTLKDHSYRVNSVVFSPNSAFLASGSEDKTVKIWEFSSGTCLQTLKDHSDRINSVAFSPNSAFLASGSEDNTVKVWDVSSGACLQTLEGHIYGVTSVAFSPNSAFLASGSEDKTVKIWGFSSGACLQTLKSHSHWITSVAFSPNSAILASGSEDNTIEVWEVSSGACQQTIEKNNNHVAFSSASLISILKSGPIIDPSNTWISEDTDSCLWLQREYRPHCLDISGQYIGIGTSEGKVWICCLER